MTIFRQNLQIPNDGSVLSNQSLSDLINRKVTLRPNETIYVQKSIFECLNFLIKNNKIRLATEFNEGKVYRAGGLKSGNEGDGFMPISKNKTSGCGDIYNETEAIWFGKKPLKEYLNFPQGEPYGLITCRQLKNVDSVDNKINAFINLSTKEIPPCSNLKGETAYFLSRSIQEHFNKCMVIPMLRIYCTSVINNYPNTDLTYDEIMNQQDIIILDLKVNGYQCDPNYGPNPTLREVLEAWNYQTRRRLSIYSPDRLQIDVFFYIIDIMNEIIEAYGNSNSITNYTEHIPNLTGVKILGWTCEDTPRTGDCITFHGETAISMKYLKKPARYGIFEPLNLNGLCKPRFYRKTLFGGVVEVPYNDPDMRGHLVRYIGGKKEIDIKNNDFMLLNSGPEKIKLRGMNDIDVNMPKENNLPKIGAHYVGMSKDNKLPELSSRDLEINQIFITSPEEEKLYTKEDKKISDFFSKIIEKEKKKEKEEEEEKEEEYVGGKKYKFNSKKRTMYKSKKSKKSKKRTMTKY